MLTADAEAVAIETRRKPEYTHTLWSPGSGRDVNVLTSGLHTEYR